MNADHERFRAQLLHFSYAYGISLRELTMHLTGGPTRAYEYMNGTIEPRRATRQRWRRFMRNYRKSLLVWSLRYRAPAIDGGIPSRRAREQSSVKDGLFVAEGTVRAWARATKRSSAELSSGVSSGGRDVASLLIGSVPTGRYTVIPSESLRKR